MGEQVAAGLHSKTTQRCVQSTVYSDKRARGLVYGGIAQLGEHLPCKQGVKGSNPFISTVIITITTATKQI